MAEHAIDLEQLMSMPPSLNGHEQDVAAPAADALPAEKAIRVDPARGVVITPKGELELSGKRITGLMLERVSSQGKPKIPMVKVTLMGKHEQLEANPNDPNYLALLAEWKAESDMRMMRYVFTVGIKGQPPQDFIEEQSVWFPEATDAEMKYLYVASFVPDDLIQDFNEAVMGYSIPTAKGLEEAGNFTG